MKKQDEEDNESESLREMFHSGVHDLVQEQRFPRPPAPPEASDIIPAEGEEQPADAGDMNLRAEVVWMDGAVTVIPRSSDITVRKAIGIHDPKFFILLNQGRPDPTPVGAPAPEPEFISALTLYLAPDECIPLGSFIGAIDEGGGKWTVVRPGDWKQPAGYPVDKFPSYAPCATHHIIEGGKMLYLEIAKRSDPWRAAELMPSQAQMNEVLRMLDPNWAFLVRRQRFYTHLFQDMYRYDEKAWDESLPIPNGQHNIGYLINPFGFAKRWSGSYTAGSVCNLWMFGTKEGGVSNRVEFYDIDAMWMLAGCLTGNVDSILMGRTLYLYKVAHGFLNCKEKHRKQYRWCGEHSIGGLMGDAESKQFWMSTAIAKKLWPDDPIIDDVYQKGIVQMKTYPHWGGESGAREFGNKIKNAWYMLLASEDMGIWQHAAEEIDYVFRNYVKDENYLEDGQGTGICWPGESMAVSLKYIFAWYHDGQIGQALIQGQTFDQRNPNFAQKLQDMLTWMCRYGGAYVDPSKTMFRAAYRSKQCTNTSALSEFKGDLQGVFWAGLETRATTDEQREVIAAVEKLTFESKGAFWANPIANCGADVGAQGPGWVKWFQGIVGASSLRGGIPLGTKLSFGRKTDQEDPQPTDSGRPVESEPEPE